MRIDPLPATAPATPGVRSLHSPNGGWRRPLRWAVPLVVALVVGWLAGMGFAAVIHMPKVDSLASFTPGQITRLYDSDETVFADYARERRDLLLEGEVPETLHNAVIAAEDGNFYQHGGVDIVGVARAFSRNFLTSRRTLGASTITMQLARKLFLYPEKKWRRKIEEAFLSVELEKTYSKEQILTLYCNLMFLGHGNYGMQSAALDYFGKTVDRLTVPEAATLAGILQRPSDYSPYRSPEAVVGRRNYVLRRMFEEEYIDKQEYDQALATPLEVLPRQVEVEPAPYLAEDVRQHLEDAYGSTALLEQGLQVKTTLDQQIQAAAERSLRQGLTSIDRRRGWRGPIEHLDEADLESVELASWKRVDPRPDAWRRGLVLSTNDRTARIKVGKEILQLGAAGMKWTRKSRPDAVLEPGDVAWFRIERGEDDELRLFLEQTPEVEGAVVVIESATGAIRGLVGGWDFDRSKFNRATQAKRQIGSAFKPFVYGASFESGFTAADTLFDAPVVFLGAENTPTYSPRNYYRRYYGIITLRRALELSANVTAVKLQDLVGVDRVVDFARRAGVESDLPPYPSLALGAAELTPLELATGYAAIANGGISMEPYMIERVERADGSVLDTHVPRARKAMTPETAYLLTAVLEGVVDRGTAKAINDLDVDLAGKTGTTDSYTDAWFAGFTPRYTIVTWVGYDAKRVLGRNMTGAEAALPIWRSIVEEGLESGWITPAQRFQIPSGIEFEPLDYRTGLLAGSGSPVQIDEAFLRGSQPALTYEPRWAEIVELPWYQQRPFYVARGGEKMPDDVRDWTLVKEAWER